jgi:hypothetical protein
VWQGFNRDTTFRQVVELRKRGAAQQRLRVRVVLQRKEDAELTLAWTSARKVLGPFRCRGEAGAGGGETPGVVRPAA